MGVAIKVENLSKAYQLGEIGTGTLSNDLKRWAYKVRGKEDPFLKIGETNDRTTKSESDIVWSLKDLDFEIEQGDAVGIIGRNGAGKSTLLKILSRVTSPTTGSVKVKGRVASLLEVGTGFHPELTGRENIFLNGAILGMRKAEIKKHFDAIVDFAGVERYIDTPVKRYSSGMYVRLAFAVAAHLESEILVVDEVLAVGDAEFQKKCLGKMNEVSKGEGRTVLFVSHNINSVNALCNKGILLTNGKMEMMGSSSVVTERYLNFQNILRTSFESPSQKKTGVEIKKIFTPENKKTFDITDLIEVFVKIDIHSYEREDIAVILKKDDLILSTSFLKFAGNNDCHILQKQSKTLKFNLPQNILKEGIYHLDFHVGEIKKSVTQKIEDEIIFEITNNEQDTSYSSYTKERAGLIGMELSYKYVS